MTCFHRFGFPALAALMLTLLIAPASFAGIIHVSTTGDDANDGSTWALAKRTVQAGLDAVGLYGPLNHRLWVPGPVQAMGRPCREQFLRIKEVSTDV